MQEFLKVLQPLAWAFSRHVGVVEDSNFTGKALFHSPIFGEVLIELSIMQTKKKSNWFIRE
jgi:hypothetical protein